MALSKESDNFTEDNIIIDINNGQKNKEIKIEKPEKPEKENLTD